MINCAAADICTAFEDDCIGSKVTDEDTFDLFLNKAILNHDTTKDRVPGQHFIVLPDAVSQAVSCGVGLNSDDPDNYVLREHRGRVSSYLKRRYACPTTGVSVVVYTVAAYLGDPDVTAEETARIKLIDDEYPGEPVTHVIVAVLAHGGPAPQLSPYRFVHNLAGGNLEAFVWSADEIRAKAVDIKAYDDMYSVVADSDEETDRAGLDLDERDIDDEVTDPEAEDTYECDECQCDIPAAAHHADNLYHAGHCSMYAPDQT